MAKRSHVGEAFWIPLGSGFATGIVTYEHPQYLQLVWMAREFLDEPPTEEDIRNLTWQWCTYFPAAVATRRRIVQPIGTVDIPESIQTPPLLRSGARLDNWVVVDVDFHTLRKATQDDRGFIWHRERHDGVRKAGESLETRRLVVMNRPGICEGRFNPTKGLVVPSGWKYPEESKQQAC